MARLGSSIWSLSCVLAGFRASHPWVLRASPCARGSFVWSLLAAWASQTWRWRRKGMPEEEKAARSLKAGAWKSQTSLCLVLSVKASRRPTRVQEKANTHIPRPARDLRTPAFSLGIHFLSPALVAPQSRRSLAPSRRASRAPSSVHDTLRGSE